MADGATMAWGAPALQSRLQALLPGIGVEVVGSATSTNSVLLERDRASLRAAAGAALQHGDAPRPGAASLPPASATPALPPCLLVAEHQTAGRGRLGRSWQSAPGASLTFSLALTLADDTLAGLSLAVGVAVAQALEPAGSGAPRIGLKWPNDLWLLDAGPATGPTGRKLGGILIETVMVGPRRRVVIGLGLNVMAFEAGSVNTGFAALRELDPTATAPAVLARVVVPLVQALQRFEREGFAAFAADFARRDVLRGQAVSTSLPGVPQGVADGVSSDGALLVRTASGTLPLVSGEVSVRMAA
jgi:BirA family biotin operon repressor/biotin-[acetyl-CoA-carboxylase] ligase